MYYNIIRFQWYVTDVYLFILSLRVKPSGGEMKRGRGVLDPPLVCYINNNLKYKL